ncbi:MAG: DUF1491 family protein [Cohaesibacteraceae bacterium]
MRLTSDFVVSVLIRRVEQAGAYATVARRGDATAGAIFVLVDGLLGEVALYGPAPFTLDDKPLPDEAAITGNRLFVRMPLEPDQTRAAAEAVIEREERFDSDLWLVDIEDRAMRAFVPVVDPT